MCVCVCAGSGFGDFGGFQSVSAPPQPPVQQQSAPFADFGAFQSTPSTGMSQVHTHIHIHAGGTTHTVCPLAILENP